YMPEPGLAMWLQPRLLNTVHEVPPIQPTADVPDPNADPAADPVGQRSILDALHALEEIDGADGTEPAVFLMVQQITELKLNGFPEFPTPISLTASLTPSDTPRLVARLEFNSEADALGFIDTWPAIADAADGLGVFGLGDTLRGIEMERDGRLVYSDGNLSGFMVRMLLIGATSILPDVRPKAD